MRGNAEAASAGGNMDALVAADAGMRTWYGYVWMMATLWQ